MKHVSMLNFQKESKETYFPNCQTIPTKIDRDKLGQHDNTTSAKVLYNCSSAPLSVPIFNKHLNPLNGERWGSTARAVLYLLA